jgi:aminopeptidase-like protein
MHAGHGGMRDMQVFGNGVRPEIIGRDMYQLMSELYPLCRSITGNGVRKTLQLLRHQISLEIYEVPSGTKVYDWTVPKEWNIQDAYLKNAKGEKIVDFTKSNLHVLNYSIPVKAKVSLTELKEHLYTIPDYPDWIPYRTSYYRENWGFCLSHKQFQDLTDSEYEVFIDSTLEPGSLTYGEFVVKGSMDDEVLLSCHICHPSLCNDNLSGIVLMTFLAKYLSTLPVRYTYRFLFIPGTIGSITWLSLNESKVSKIRHGLVAACLGDSGHFTYKKSRRGMAEIDRIVVHALKSLGDHFAIQEFIPFGYDERQFCSPGFDLPVGCFMRTPHGQYPEYHTSADDLDFVRSEQLAESFLALLAILNILENNATYVNQNPKCEPQLGKRGLYRTVGGQQDTRTRELAMLWVLNLSDGSNSLLDIAERASLPFDVIRDAADDLKEAGLLKQYPG